jgi:transcriptional regulator with XRE-family HTH domain
MDGLGQRIRNLRKARRLVLQDIADATNLSVGFLSQVERGIAFPSISSLALIAAALNVGIEAFLPPSEPISGVSRAGRRRPFAIDPRSITYERLSTDFPGHTLSAAKVRVPPGYRSESSAHSGEEVVYVLVGAIRYVVGDNVFDLYPGDALHFAARERHRVENIDQGFTELISIGTLEIFGGMAKAPRPNSEDLVQSGGSGEKGKDHDL